MAVSGLCSGFFTAIDCESFRDSPFCTELWSVIQSILRVDLAIREFYESPSIESTMRLTFWSVFPLLVISSGAILGTAFAVYLLVVNIFFTTAIGLYVKNTGIENLQHPLDFFSEDNLFWKICIGITAWFPMAMLEKQLEVLMTSIFGLMGIVLTQGQDIALLLSSGGFWGAIWIIFGCIFAPITEELLFRGYGEKSAENDLSITQKFMAALKSNIVFGAIHMSPFQGWFNIPIFVITFSMGMVFSLLREATGDLCAPTVCHAMNNILATALLLR